jgi:hypothetical protein
MEICGDSDKTARSPPTKQKHLALAGFDETDSDDPTRSWAVRD